MIRVYETEKEKKKRLEKEKSGAEPIAVSTKKNPVGPKRKNAGKSSNSAPAKRIRKRN